MAASTDEQYSRTGRTWDIEGWRTGRTWSKEHGRLKMDTRIVGDVAVICSEEPIINDAQSALDLIAEVVYGHGVNKIAANKPAVNEGFFRLGTGLAGEVAQKFVNYRCRFAIFGDFSGYDSKPLHDYMSECNKGRHLNFAADESEALEKLRD